jgi:hypothetical protein
MKHLSIALVAMASLSLMTTVRAADDVSSAQILERLQGLTHRLDRMEQENVALRAEIAQLKAHAAEPAKEATVAKVADKPVAKAADWPDRIQIKGDVRYRAIQSDDERVAAKRDEHVLRARLSVEAKVNDSISAVVGIATSQGGNPRGANLQLDGEFSRKPLYLDLGYVDWTIAPGLHAIGGKMKMPFARPGQSLFWDNDINPEGIAFTYANGSLFGSAYGFWVEENVQYAATASAVNDTTDTRMYGLQVGNRFKFGGSELMIAAMYYDLAAGQGRRPFFSGSNGNSVAGPNGVLAEDFEVIEAQAEFNTKLGDLPLQVWADFAHNAAAELSDALGIGALLGKASAPGTWEAGLGYQFIDKDALFAQHIDSDFAGGVSDSQGWMLRAGFAPLKNWSLNATYYPTEANVDAGSEYDFARLLLDFNVKF